MQLERLCVAALEFDLGSEFRGGVQLALKLRLDLSAEPESESEHSLLQEREWISLEDPWCLSETIQGERVVVIYLRYEDRLKRKIGRTKINKSISDRSFRLRRCDSAWKSYRKKSLTCL
jgi:hypothetical protein